LYTISPATPGASGFTLAGALTNSSTNLQTVSDAISLPNLATYVTTTAGGGDLTVNGNVSGAGGIAKEGAGTLNLAGSNSYSGGTRVDAGTLQLTGSLNSSGGLAVGGGTFVYAHAPAAAQAVNGLTVYSGASVINNTTAGTLALGPIAGRYAGGTIDFLTTTGTITTTATNTNGILGPWAFVGAGAGALYAYNNNGTIAGFSGATVESGNGIFGGIPSGDSGTINYNVASSGTFAAMSSSCSINTIACTGSGATQSAASNTSLTINGIMNTGTGPLTIGGSPRIDVTVGSNQDLVVATMTSGVVINNNISDSSAGASALTKIGSGNLTLGGTNTYSGPTTIGAGTLQIGTGGAAGSLATGSVITDNGTLAFSRSNNTSQGTDFSSAPISGTGGIVKLGAGNLTLNALNTYSGNVTVGGGTLTVGSGNQYNVAATASALGDPSIAGRTVTINNGALLAWGAGNQLGGPQTGEQPSLSFAINQGGAMVGYNGDMNTIGNLTLNGGTLTTRNGYQPDAAGTQSFYLAGGNVAVANAASTIANGGTSYSGIHLAATTTFNVAATGGAGADLTVSTTLADRPVNDPGASVLVKTGAGLMQLNAYNTYSGGTTVNGGTLTLAVGGGTGAVRGPLNINPGAAVNLTAGDALGYNSGACVTAVSVSGGRIDNAVNYNNGYSTNFLLTGGSMTSSGGYPYDFSTAYGVATNASNSTSVISAPLDIRDANSLTFNVAAGAVPSGVDLLVSGIIENGRFSPSINAITKTGAGLMQITSNSTYTGGTTIADGTLQVGTGGNTAALGTGSVVVGSAGTLVFDRNDSYTVSNSINGATLNGAGTLYEIGSGTLTYAGNSAGLGLVVVGPNSTDAAVLNIVPGSTLNTAGELWLSAAGGAKGTMNVTGGVVTIGSWLAVGRGGTGGVLNVSGGSLNVASNNLTIASFAGNQGQVNVSGGTVNAVNSIYVGESGTGTMTLSASGLVTANTVMVGYNSGATGAYTQTGGTLAAPGGLMVWSGTGSITVSQTGGTPTLVTPGWITLGQNSGAVGTLTQNGGSVALGNNVWLAYGGGARGVYNLHGGSLTAYDLRTDSGAGTMYQDGGSAGFSGIELGINSGAASTYTLAGGTLSIYSFANVGESGAGTLSVGGSGGGNVLSSANILVAANAGGSGTLKLQPGGLLRTPSIAAGSGSPAFNFSGGTLQNAPSGNLTVAMPVTLSGTATVAIDSGQTVTFQSNAPLAGSGSLFKTGAGTLTVQSNNTYAGPTVINGGVLQLGNAIPQLSYNFTSGFAVNTGNNANTVTTAPVGSPLISATGGPNGLGLMALNGSNYLDIQASSLPNLSGGANYTIGMWINATEAGASVLYKGASGAWSSGDEDFYLTSAIGNNANGDTSGTHIGGVQWGGAWVGGNSAVNTGNWKFVAIVRSGGTSTMYVNGVADGVATGMYNAEQGTQEMDIGYNSGVAHDGALMFSGSISGTYVYGAALTQAQIQALMNAGSSGVYGALPATTALSITNSAAAFDLNDARQTVASLSGVAGSRVYLGGGTLTVGNSGSTTFAGNISDGGGASSRTGGSLILSGIGKLVLAGTNTYAGGTFVEGNGTLIVANRDAIEDGSNLYVGAASSVFAPIISPSQPAVAGGNPDAPAAAVPEPGTLLLLAAGTVATILVVWRRNYLSYRD